MLTGGRTWSSSIHLPEEGNTSIAFRLTGACQESKLLHIGRWRGCQSYISHTLCIFMTSAYCYLEHKQNNGRPPGHVD